MSYFRIFIFTFPLTVYHAFDVIFLYIIIIIIIIINLPACSTRWTWVDSLITCVEDARLLALCAVHGCRGCTGCWARTPRDAATHRGAAAIRDGCYRNCSTDANQACCVWPFSCHKSQLIFYYLDIFREWTDLIIVLLLIVGSTSSKKLEVLPFQIGSGWNFAGLFFQWICIDWRRQSSHVTSLSIWRPCVFILFPNAFSWSFKVNL